MKGFVMSSGKFQWMTDKIIPKGATTTATGAGINHAVYSEHSSDLRTIINWVKLSLEHCGSDLDGAMHVLSTGYEEMEKINEAQD